MEAEEATNSVSPVSGSDPGHGISDEREKEEYHSDDDGDRNRREPKDSLSMSSSSIDRKEILGALEMVERDCVAVADSFSSLVASLRLDLSEVTGRTVDHVHCFNDAAGRLQESALDATTKGSRYINACLRLNEETRGVNSLAMHMYPSKCYKAFKFVGISVSCEVNSIVKKADHQNHWFKRK